MEKVRVNRVDKKQRRRAKLKAREASRVGAIHSYGMVPLASVETTAKYLGNISSKTVYRLIEDGKLEAVRIGARFMVKTASAMPVSLAKSRGGMGPGIGSMFIQDEE